MRKLGIPSIRDKVVHEVMHMILEAIYDSPYGAYFLPTSHGFRPNRSCHTALREYRTQWRATNWLIEGDIHACFDELAHEVLVHLLRKKITDERFLNLIWKLLRAGYMDVHGEMKDSLIGSPQGGIVTPPTMLQTLWGYGGDFFVRGRLGAVGANSEDDPNLFLSDFDPFDQGADNLAAGQPIRRLQTICDVRRKILKATEHERQFCFQTSFISRLLDGCFQVLQTLAQSRHPWFKLCFVNQPLGVAINQACYPLAHLPHLAF